MSHKGVANPVGMLSGTDLLYIEGGPERNSQKQVEDTKRALGTLQSKEGYLYVLCAAWRAIARIVLLDLQLPFRTPCGLQRATYVGNYRLTKFPW